jgi:hypothetical protein
MVIDPTSTWVSKINQTIEWKYKYDENEPKNMSVICYDNNNVGNILTVLFAYPID